MNKDIPAEEIADVNESPEAILSGEDLKVYLDGPPADDITTQIQDLFIKKLIPPDITSISELETYRDHVIKSLKERTFRSFPDASIPFDKKMVFQTLDRAPFGSEIFSFNSEEDWQLKLDIRYRKPRTEKRPLMIVLSSPDEQRRHFESFISELNEDWNIAYIEVRGIGEAGWAPELQWHVRRASAWTGRTIASMQVYDLLRTIDFARGLADVDPTKIGIAAQGEMASVALFSALMDGNCNTLILKNPPGTLDVSSRADGRGEALEMLNVLQITDVNQMPALVQPTQTIIVGEMPESYDWSMNTLEQLNLSGRFMLTNELSEFK